MSLRRHLDREAIAHANADSKTHSRHVKRRKRDKDVRWIAEPRESSGAEIFALKAEGLDLPQGRYFVGFGSGEVVQTGVDFEKHLASVNWSRRWNYAEMKRGDKVSKVKRQRTQDACEEFVVNLSPWQMLFLNDSLAAFRKAGVDAEQQRAFLDALLGNIRKTIVSQFAAKSGRDVIGSYIHFDSTKIHFGVIHSRVDKDNNLCGEKHLGTIGPWSVAQSRIQGLGLVGKEDNRLQDNLQRFEGRFGPLRKPLDLHLHDLADAQFSKAVRSLGMTDRFVKSQEVYKSWKRKNREQGILSAISPRTAWAIIRFVSPLLPEPVRITLSVARTAVQALSIISQAVEKTTPQIPLPPEEKSYEPRRPELTQPT